jgi:hypothetical protein
MVQPGVSALGKKKSTTGLPRKSFRLTGLPSSLGTLVSGAWSPISMKSSSFELHFAHLYSKLVVFVISGFALLLMTVPWLGAQSKKAGGPRAIAVVTWNGDSPTPVPQASVLTPITILVEGRFYDANLYEAQPEPMAVDSGILYDVLKSGEPIGTFTIGGEQEKDNLWYGVGLFEPKGAMTVQMTKSGPKTTRSEQTATASGSGSDAEDRPKLRRGTPPPPAPKEQTDAVLKTIDQDPERPMLRRHTAEEIKAQQSAAASAPPPVFVPPETHILPAVSDVGGPEPHSFVPRYKTGELTQIREDMEKLVRSELEKQRKQNAPPVKSVTQRRVQAPAAPRLELNNAHFGAFDVNSDNAPIVVYSATTMIDGKKKYVTVAAWEEIDQSLRKVFSQTTDDDHLDVYPRLEIIDTVDARGNGRGELLFRAFGDTGNRFVLYHPGPDSLDLLFDSAKAESGR